MADSANLKQEARLLFPWMPEALVDVWADAFIKYGSRDLALQEVRNGEGRGVYDTVFAGNRRDDGTLKLTEAQYLQNLASYRSTLANRGLNPDLFENQYANLIRNEVWGDEFEQRVSAVQQSVIQQGEQVQRAFAEAAGMDPSEFTPEATLATLLDPDGVGRELLNRTIAVAQVRGAAAESGISVSQDRADYIIQQTGLSLAQARQFYTNLQSNLRTFRTLESATLGQTTIGQETLESASLLQEQDTLRRLNRLVNRETARFSTEDVVRRSQGGALSGLRAPGALS